MRGERSVQPLPSHTDFRLASERRRTDFHEIHSGALAVFNR